MDDDTPIILRNQSRLPKRRKIISDDDGPTSSPQPSANLTPTTFEDDLRAAIAICEEFDRNESHSQPFQDYLISGPSFPPQQLVRDATPVRNGRTRSRPSSSSYSTHSPPAHSSLAPTMDVSSPQLECADFDFGGDDSVQSQQFSQRLSQELVLPPPTQSTQPIQLRARPPIYAHSRARPRSPALFDSPCPPTPPTHTGHERTTVDAVSASSAESLMPSATSTLTTDSATTSSSSSSSSYSSAPPSLTASTSTLSSTRSTPADSHVSPTQSSHLSPTPARAHAPSTPSRNDLRALSRHASSSAATPARTHLHAHASYTAPQGLRQRSSVLVSPFFTSCAPDGQPGAARAADVSEASSTGPSSLATRSPTLGPTAATASASVKHVHANVPAHVSADPLAEWHELAFGADADASSEGFGMPAGAGDPSADMVLQCGICLEHVSEPAVPAACTHACCYACLLTWFSASSTCPLCTTQVDYINLYPAHALEQYVRSRHELGRPLGRRDASGQPVGGITPPPSPLRGEPVSYVKQRTVEYIEVGDQLLAVPSAVEERLEQTVCVVCGSGDDGDGADPLMDLLLCDGDGGACTRAMHVRCHYPEQLTSVPPGNWYCDEHRAHNSYAHPRAPPRDSGRRRRRARLVETDSESENNSSSSSSDISEPDVITPLSFAASRGRAPRRTPATPSPAPTVARWVSVVQSSRTGTSGGRFNAYVRDSDSDDEVTPPTRRAAPISRSVRSSGRSTRTRTPAAAQAPSSAAPAVPRHERLRAQAQAGRTPSQWLPHSHGDSFLASFSGTGASTTSFSSSSLPSARNHSATGAPIRVPSAPSRAPYAISASHVFPTSTTTTPATGGRAGTSVTGASAAIPRSNLYRRSHAAPTITTTASASAPSARSTPSAGVGGSAQPSSSGPTLMQRSFASLASHAVFNNARARSVPTSTGPSSSFFPNTARTLSTAAPAPATATSALVSSGAPTSAVPMRATHLYARRRGTSAANGVPAPAGSRLATMEQRLRDMEAEFVAALPPSQRGPTNTNTGSSAHRWLG